MMCARRARTIQFQFGRNNWENIARTSEGKLILLLNNRIESNRIDFVYRKHSIESEWIFNFFGAATPGEKISLLQLILKEVKGLKFEAEISILHQESHRSILHHPIFLDIRFSNSSSWLFSLLYSRWTIGSQLDRFVCTAFL